MKNENYFETFHEFLSIFQVHTKVWEISSNFRPLLDDVNRDFDFLKNNRADFKHLRNI